MGSEGSLLSESLLKCGHVDLTSEMDRTFPMNRVPTRWVRCTEILGLQANAHHSLFFIKVHYSRCRIPSGPTRGSSQHFNAREPSVSDFDGEIWRPKELSIWPQADLPGKTASSWGG